MRNLVLITVDSFRADHCSFMGYERETTPALDSMAADGLVFENAIAPGPTTPESLPAIFTGRYPVQGRGEVDELASKRDRIRSHMEARDTLPQRLSRMGYTTAAFTPNPWTSRYFDFDHGFDHFEDFMGADLSSSIWEQMLEGRESTVFTATRLLLSWIQRENVFKPWRSFYDDVIAWVDSAPEPYFLWVFLLDVHFPYLPAGGHRSQSRWRQYEANLRLYLESQQSLYPARVDRQLVTAYDDAIRDTDEFFGRLRDDLDDDTIMLVHGDHGEAFGEHGTYTHQNQLYEENIHVPLVASGVERRRITMPVSLRSIPNLLTHLAESTVPTPTAPFVQARTDENSAMAARGSRIKCIQQRGSTDLYDLEKGEGDPVDNEELTALCEDVARAKREATAEEARLKVAAREVADES